MQLFVIVLNRVEFLEDLLAAFVANGIKGATIIDSTGMARAMGEDNEKRFLGSLRMLLDPERQENKTIFMVIEKEKIALVKEAVYQVLGSFDAPNTGIMFHLPIEFAEGHIKKDIKEQENEKAF